MHLSAAALLEWYLLAGVDECIDPEPANRFLPERTAHPHPVTSPKGESIVTPSPSRGRAGVGVKSPVEVKPSAPLYSAAASPPAEAMAEAARLAAQASTLAELEEAVRGFGGLAIKKTATRTVFADGNPQSRLMLLGEAPGVEEDRRGIPFCGPSGKLLDKMMAAIGRDRTRFYISNTLFWRPPGNRQPSDEELAACRPFVEKHIALVNPRLLVLIGGTATKGVLQDTRGITRLRGTALSYTTPLLPHAVPVIATYHPSYLLRTPGKKREAWQDMLAIEAKMTGS